MGGLIFKVHVPATCCSAAHMARAGHQLPRKVYQEKNPSMPPGSQQLGRLQ